MTTSPTTRRIDILDVDRTVGAYRVRAVQVIGTPHVFFRAWEPNIRSADSGGHSTVSSMGEGAFAGTWGTVASRRLPADLEAMAAGSPERIAAVEAYHAALDAEAVAAIHEAFPWLAEVGTVDGDQVLTDSATVVMYEPEAEAF